MAISLYEKVRETIKARFYLLSANDLSPTGILYPLKLYAGKPSLSENDLQVLRNSILAIDTAALSSNTWRVLGDILQLTDIGAMEKVKLDGSTSLPIAQTLGRDSLETFHKSDLVSATNEIGDISKIKLDGSTPATTLVAAIGTGTLSASITDRTSIIAAINSLIAPDTNANIDVSGHNFYGCVNGETVNNATDIFRPTTSLESLVLKWIECAKFASKETATGYAPEGDGATCLALTSPGDAFAKCLGTLMTTTSYTHNADGTGA
jgi:hypothetical protein